MTATAHVICRPAVAAGFALAGIVPHETESEQGAETILTELGSREDVGVVLIQSDLHEAIPEETRARFDRLVKPVIVPFPAPSWAKAESPEERVIALLRHAIGYRVKLR
jgi:V/A-type H+-transporting ATPase subunit F